MTWSPGHRAARRALGEPFTDVPSHLASPLSGWVYALLADSVSRTRALVIALRWDVEVIGTHSESYGDYLAEETIEDVKGKVAAEPTRVLDIIEWLLESEVLGSMATELDRLLTAGKLCISGEAGRARP